MKKFLCLVVLACLCFSTSFAHTKTVTHHSTVVSKSAPHTSTNLSFVSPQIHQPAAVHIVGISSMNPAQPAVIAMTLQTHDSGALATTMMSGTGLATTQIKPYHPDTSPERTNCAKQGTNFSFADVSQPAHYTIKV